MRLMGKAGCHLLIFCCCFLPPSGVFPLPALSGHFHTGVRAWESHEHGTTLGNSVAGGLYGTDLLPYLYNGCNGETRVVHKSNEFLPVSHFLELNSCLSFCYPESLGSIPLGVRIFPS